MLARQPDKAAETLTALALALARHLLQIGDQRLEGAREGPLAQLTQRLADLRLAEEGALAPDPVGHGHSCQRFLEEKQLGAGATEDGHPRPRRGRPLAA